VSAFTAPPVIRLQITLAFGSFLNGCSLSQSLTYGDEHVSRRGPVPLTKTNLSYVQAI